MMSPNSLVVAMVLLKAYRFRHYTEAGNVTDVKPDVNGISGSSS